MSSKLPLPMFGTLISDLHQKKQLTFVENKNHASALNRNKRDKPHFSCQYCRSRKIRCSDEPSGCEKCRSLMLDCHYEEKRKKRITSKSNGSLGVRDQSTEAKGPGSGKGTRSNNAIAGEKTHQQPEPDNRVSECDRCQNFNNSEYTGYSECGHEGITFPPSPLSTELFNGPLSIPDIDYLIDLESVPHNASPFNSLDISSIPYSGMQTPLTSDNILLPSSKINENDTGDEYDWQSLMGSINLPPTYSGIEDKREGASLTSIPAQSSSKAGEESWGKSLMGHERAGFDVCCRCREFTTSLFEELCAESKSSHRSSLDALLGHFRGSLKLIATILNCNSCQPPTESNMLLAMAGHYMGTINERIVQDFIRWKEEGGESSIPKDDSSEIRFSSYRIDDKSELIQVLGSIISFQLSQFSFLLERLKTRIGMESGSRVLLDETTKKVKTARSALQAVGGPAGRQDETTSRNVR
ncbi:hypothetical protein DM02DRAFT_670396 [Periconia macrospinosa]|uniref:Zn(2)-C6 fungal-type domain-containing protein n=1 Tax=Periconia macrospinosa TaxID=97972 RepID=A0A2V1DX40_9PLEO|nr:hypothetical protein DM02DRAFT_670396 [Periconia macrospinosa]